MLRFCKLLFSMLFLIPGLLRAQNYLWPTNASNFVSSSFCEFREGHYHAAIDIKTWLREGYPCYAIADGYVARIRVSPTGYGKVIYLKLTDGNTAVYAHLQRFAAPLETIIRDWQLKHQSYTLDLAMDSIKFKQGDIIAYNGGTGVGPPHLHFEIRNQQDHPLNPLQFYPQHQDPLPPGLKSVICIPLSAGARINGSYLPRKFQLVRTREGTYTVQQPVRIKGSVGLGIKGFDQAVELGNSFGFYQTLMIVNTDTVFNIRYDELNFDQTIYINTEIYYPQWIRSGEVFHKLYIDDFNPLGFYRRQHRENGIITMGDKAIPITILVKDIRLNTSLCKLELRPDSTADLYIEDLRRQDKWVYLTLVSDRCREIFFKTGRNLSTLKPVKYFEIIDGSIGNSAAGIKFKVQLNDNLDSILKVSAEVSAEASDRHLSEQILSLRSDSTYYLKQEPEFHFLGSDLVLRFRHLPNYGTIKSASPQLEFPLRRTDQDYSEVLLPGDLLSGKNHRLKLYSSLAPGWLSDIEMHQLDPGIGQTFSWFDSALVITTSGESVLDTVLITADTVSAATVTTGMPVTGPVFQLRPVNFPWYADFLLQLRVNALPGWGKWSIYQIESSGKISYLPSNIDSANLTLSAHASSFGMFLIASDTIPPLLEIISPQNGQEYARNPGIKLKLDDLHSGIETERNIALSLDGNYVIPEWDPEKNVIVTDYGVPLAPGAHTFTVSLKDQCGNTNRQAVRFIIKKSLKN
jgi:hypothetical protein